MRARKVGTRAAVVLGLFGAFCAFPSEAHAQENGGAQLPSERVVTTLDAEGGLPLQVELFNPSANVRVDRPIARCTTPCFARLPTGRYKLFVHETGSTLSGARVFELRGASRIVVSPDDDSQRTAGLVLGIGGPVAMIAGVVVAVLSVPESHYDSSTGTSNRGSTDQSMLATGVLLVLGGLVATPIGWVMFGRSFKPDLKITTGPDEASMGVRHVGAFATPSGMTLGLHVDF